MWHGDLWFGRGIWRAWASFMMALLYVSQFLVICAIPNLVQITWCAIHQHENQPPALMCLQSWRQNKIHKAYFTKLLTTEFVCGLTFAHFAYPCDLKHISPNRPVQTTILFLAMRSALWHFWLCHRQTQLASSAWVLCRDVLATKTRMLTPSCAHAVCTHT
jgi:hypothetical protein